MNVATEYELAGVIAVPAGAPVERLAGGRLGMRARCIGPDGEPLDVIVMAGAKHHSHRVIAGAVAGDWLRVVGTATLVPPRPWMTAPLAVVVDPDELALMRRAVPTQASAATPLRPAAGHDDRRRSTTRPTDL